MEPSECDGSPLPSADRADDWQRLDPRAMFVDRVVLGIWTAALSALLLLLSVIVLVVPATAVWARVVGPLAWLVATAGLSWFAVRWPAISYRHARYRVSGDRLEIARGTVWRNVIAVPRARVQHIDVEQGPFERRYGLATVSVYTAGTEYSRVDLGGLAHGVAFALRDRLLPGDAPDGV